MEVQARSAASPTQFIDETAPIPLTNVSSGAYYTDNSQFPVDGSGNYYLTIPQNCSRIYFTMIGAGARGQDGGVGNLDQRGGRGGGGGGYMSFYLGIPDSSYWGRTFRVNVGIANNYTGNMRTGNSVVLYETRGPESFILFSGGEIFAVAGCGTNDITLQQSQGGGSFNGSYTWNFGAFDSASFVRLYGSASGLTPAAPQPGSFIDAIGGAGGEIDEALFLESDPLFNYYYDKIGTAGQGGHGGTANDLIYTVTPSGDWPNARLSDPTAVVNGEPGKNGFMSVRYVYGDIQQPFESGDITNGSGSITIPSGATSMDFILIGGGGGGCEFRPYYSPYYVYNFGGGAGGNISGTMDVSGLGGFKLNYKVGGGGRSPHNSPTLQDIYQGHYSTYGENGYNSTLSLQTTTTTSQEICMAGGGWGGANGDSDSTTRTDTFHGRPYYPEDQNLYAQPPPNPGTGGLVRLTSDRGILNILRNVQQANGNTNSSPIGDPNPTPNNGSFRGGLFGNGGSNQLSGSSGLFYYKFYNNPPSILRNIYNPTTYITSKTEVNGTIAIPTKALLMEVFMVGAGGGCSSPNITTTNGARTYAIGLGGGSGFKLHVYVDIRPYLGTNIQYHLGGAGLLNPEQLVTPGNYRGRNGGEGGAASLTFSPTLPAQPTTLILRAKGGKAGLAYDSVFSLFNSNPYPEEPYREYNVNEPLPIEYSNDGPIQNSDGDTFVDGIFGLQRYGNRYVVDGFMRPTGGLLPLQDDPKTDYYGRGGGDAGFSGDPERQGGISRDGFPGLIAYRFYSKVTIDDPAAIVDGSVKLTSKVPVWHTASNTNYTTPSNTFDIPPKATRIGFLLVGHGQEGQGGDTLPGVPTNSGRNGGLAYGLIDISSLSNPPTTITYSSPQDAGNSLVTIGNLFITLRNSTGIFQYGAANPGSRIDVSMVNIITNIEGAQGWHTTENGTYQTKQQPINTNNLVVPESVLGRNETVGMGSCDFPWDPVTRYSGHPGTLRYFFQDVFGRNI
jgi:hypothetical protein